MLVYMSGLFGSALSFFAGILVGVAISMSLLVRPFDISHFREQVLCTALGGRCVSPDETNDKGRGFLGSQCPGRWEE